MVQRIARPRRVQPLVPKPMPQSSAGNCKQDEALVARVCSLARSGATLQRIDGMLHAEGLPPPPLPEHAHARVRAALASVFRWGVVLMT